MIIIFVTSLCNYKIMKNKTNIALKFSGALALFLGIIGFLGYRSFNKTFLEFEDDVVERIDIQELNIDGLTFLDSHDYSFRILYKDLKSLFLNNQFLGY